MIKAEELMIGNYVNDENGFLMEVCSIHDDGTVYCDFDGNEGDVWEFDEKNPPKGIEITHEELERLGFIDFGGRYYYHKDTFGWFRLHNDNSLEYSINSAEVCSVKHVHELQNLFYALTGEQLKYA